MSVNLLSLLQLSDATLPIGSYAHSFGLETYVQKKIVRDRESAGRFIIEMLTRNLQYTDAAFVSLAFDAASAGDFKAILQLDAECSAMKLPSETRQASRKLGTRLIKIFQPLCKCAFSDRYRTSINLQEADGHYCIAFGIYAHALAIKKAAALAAFYYNAASAMATNCVKLVPLGQLEGQEILFSLQNLLDGLVANSIHPDKERLGVCCPGFDIRCMQHEQLYSRLYMS